MKDCIKCGASNLEAIMNQPYHYTACGLDEVYLIGIKRYACKECGEGYTEFPRIKHLHRIIGKALCQKAGELTGKEISFLRKEMRKSGKEFAQMIGVSPEHFSRLEHGQKLITSTIDRLIRSFYIIYAHEGMQVCKGTLEQITKSSKDQTSLRIELTPSDWLMEENTECYA